MINIYMYLSQWKLMVQILLSLSMATFIDTFYGWSVLYSNWPEIGQEMQNNTTL